MSLTKDDIVIIKERPSFGLTPKAVFCFKTTKRVIDLPNYRILAFKLQKALIAKGRKIAINQQQIYSEKQGGMMTKYMLKENNESIFEAWKAVEVVKFLAGELNGGDN